jgi:hypothetical protein
VRSSLQVGYAWVERTIVDSFAPPAIHATTSPIVSGQRQGDRTVTVTLGTDRLGVDVDPDAFSLERVLQLSADERLLGDEQPVGHLDHRDLLSSEPTEGLGHLDPDHAPAEDQQPDG